MIQIKKVMDKRMDWVWFKIREKKELLKNAQI